MEKLQNPPIQETELGAKRLALANAQHDVDLNNRDDVKACIEQNVSLMRTHTSTNVFEFVGRKTIQLFDRDKDVAA